MNTLLLDILNDAKHKHKFPPSEEALAIKVKFNAMGVLNSSRAAIDITTACINTSSLVLNEFADTVLKNLTQLGLISELEVSDVFAEAYGLVSNEARGFSIHQSPDMKRWVLDACDNKFPKILDQIQRKIRMRHLKTGGPMSSIHISESHIGNIVVGPVSESTLTATISEVVNQGGIEAELGLAIKNLVAVIGKMDASYQAERAELLDLLRGLLHEVKLPGAERSPTTIKLIWERIVQVSQVSNAVVHVVQTIGPILPGLFN